MRPLTCDQAGPSGRNLEEEKRILDGSRTSSNRDYILDLYFSELSQYLETEKRLEGKMKAND